MILALLFAFLQAVTPVGTAKLFIDPLSPQQTILVTNLPPNTVGVCTVFASLDEKLNGEQYKPRHCLVGDFSDGGYDEDWDFIPLNHTYDVTVEYQVENPDKTLSEFVSNTVRVTHIEYPKR